MRRTARRIVVALVLVVASAGIALPSVALENAPGNRTPTWKSEREHASDAGMTTPSGNRYRTGTSPEYKVHPVADISPDGTADLDGDGAGDVIEVNHAGTTTAVTIRRGSTGVRLWGVTRRNLIGLVPMRVGSPARAGVVVAWMNEPSTVPGPVGSAPRLYVLHLTAYDGRTGTVLWHWEPPAVLAGLGNEYVDALLPGSAGRASRFVVNLQDLRQYIVAGTGESWVGGSGTTEDQYGSAGDVDRDGFADVYTLETSGHLSVWSSSQSKSQLWRRSDITANFVTPVKHRNGDRLVDYVLVKMIPCQGFDCYPDTFIRTVLDGRTGKTRWTVTGHYNARDELTSVNPVGDIDGDGIADFVFSRSSAGELEFVTRSGRTNSVLWQRVFAAPCGYTDAGFPGFDVQPDGVTDQFFANGCGDQYSAGQVISGRDGSSVWHGPVPCCGVNASVDGSGDDIVGASGEFQTLGAYDVAVADGATGSPIWSFHRTLSMPMYVDGYAAAQLTADSHAEVLVTLVTPSSASVRHTEIGVVDGATGALRWVVST
ncbi:MAG: hypothetical protein QOG53_1932 [Frankiales bacterium]|jgi:hypothetical protein|nr:hypothetical protein [Frankiales bacterium]